MTELDKFKLKSYKRRFGEMSSEEAFKIAIQSEQFANDCGPFDIAHVNFIQSSMDFEKYACLLEKEEKENAT